MPPTTGLAESVVPTQTVQYIISSQAGIYPDPSPYLSQASWRVCICNHHQCYPHILLKGIIKVVVYNGRRLGSHTYIAFLILHS